MLHHTFENESNRLFCRRWIKDDESLLTSIETDVGFKSFSHAPSYDLSSGEKRIAFVENKLATYEKFGTSKLPVFLKSSNEFIGLMGIEPFIYKKQTVFELGYRLLQKHWSKGYAKEFATVLIERFFQTHRGQTLAALVHLENERSLKLTESLGFQKIEKFEHNGEPHWWLIHLRSF